MRPKQFPVFFELDKQDTCPHDELIPWLEHYKNGIRYESWRCSVCGTFYWKGPEELNNVVAFPGEASGRA